MSVVSAPPSRNGVAQRGHCGATLCAARITVVEIWPQVVEVARRYFKLPGESALLHLEIGGPDIKPLWLDGVWADLFLLVGGVLLQPQAVPQAQWFKHVLDVDGREAPASASLDRLRALVGRRHAELDRDVQIQPAEIDDDFIFLLDQPVDFRIREGVAKLCDGREAMDDITQ